MAEDLYQNYATALFDLTDKERLRDYLDAFLQLERDLGEGSEFAALLSSYNLEQRQKEEILDKVYGDTLPPSTKDFLKVVISHHRLNRFKEISASFRSLVNAELGVKEGIVYSASKLSEAELGRIMDAFSQKLGSEVTLKNVVDHTLLGGVKVAIDGKVYDGSLRNKLQGLGKALKN